AWYGTDKAVAYNDIEIRSYNFDRSGATMTLLTREGAAITDVTTLPDVPYIFFVLNHKELVALEQNGQGISNRYSLATMDHVDSITSYDKKNLLITGEQGGKVGIFKLSVVQ